MDSFIVRVYRRGTEPGREAAGLIEHVSSGKRKSFSGREELWAFLGARPAGRRGRVAQVRSKK